MGGAGRKAQCFPSNLIEVSGLKGKYNWMLGFKGQVFHEDGYDFL